MKSQETALQQTLHVSLITSSGNREGNSETDMTAHTKISPISSRTVYPSLH